MGQYFIIKTEVYWLGNGLYNRMQISNLHSNIGFYYKSQSGSK